MLGIRHKQQAVGYLPMQEDRLAAGEGGGVVFLGPSVVAMASAVRYRADHGHGERQIWILPGFTLTP